MNASEFEILARSLRPRVLRSIRRILDQEDAEDIAQDTMLRLWNIRESLDDYQSVEALGMLMARRLALNYQRGHKPGRFGELDETYTQVSSPEDEMIARQTAQRVDSILAGLPDPMATLIRLRHIEGYDNSSIAALLGSSEGAERTALSRARRRVADIFANSDLR